MTYKLDTLKPNTGSRRQKLRKGRGIAAGQGASCGFGMRGQKSRSGRPTRPGFEGGQMPLYRRLPKRGFNNKFSKKIQSINFNQISNILKKYKINANDLKESDLFEKKFLNKSKGNLKLLNVGELSIPIKIEISYASKKAIEKVEKLGGSVIITKKV